MRDFLIAALLLGGLGGCAVSNSSPPAEYGNFFPQSAPGDLTETMVTDTVMQLVVLYPPASTRFYLGQPTPDSYGIRLVQSLRQHGYALGESAIASGSQGLSLRYVLDIPEQNLYRVTVLVGSRSLSRAYETQNSTLSPAGAWARKE